MFSAAIANTRGMNSPRTPLSDTDRTLVDAWLDNQWLERGLSRHTLESYGRDLRQFGEWLAGVAIIMNTGPAASALFFPPSKWSSRKARLLFAM